MRRPRTLSAAFVRTVAKPGVYGDGYGGHGLYLRVRGTTHGRMAKNWGQRVRINGRATNLGLGTYPVVTLSEARRKALANRREIAQGRHPRRGGVPTLRTAVERVIAVRRAGWKPGTRSEPQWRSTFGEYVFPLLGDKPVSEITGADVMVMAQADDLWNRMRPTAQRVMRQLSVVLRWAIAEGHRSDNPVDAVVAALPSNSRKVRHHKAVPHAEVSEALARVRRVTRCRPGAKLAVEFLILTATRSSEARNARWDEMELDGRAPIWTIAASRMKGKTEHRVPLSTAAMAVLRQAKVLAGGSDFVFPGSNGGEKGVTGPTLGRVLRFAEVPGTLHGFRTSFRTWCGDTGVDREVAERALAHVVRNQVEAAYARTDLLERRRTAMQDWASYIAPQAGPRPD